MPDPNFLPANFHPPLFLPPDLLSAFLFGLTKTFAVLCATSLNGLYLARPERPIMERDVAAFFDVQSLSPSS